MKNKSKFPALKPRIWSNIRYTSHFNTWCYKHNINYKYSWYSDSSKLVSLHQNLIPVREKIMHNPNLEERYTGEIWAHELMMDLYYHYSCNWPIANWFPAFFSSWPLISGNGLSVVFVLWGFTEPWRVERLHYDIYFGHFRGLKRWKYLIPHKKKKKQQWEKIRRKSVTDVFVNSSDRLPTPLIYLSTTCEVGNHCNNIFNSRYDDQT